MDVFISWIIIQPHIWNTDSENLHISLSNQCYSLIVIKVPQRVAKDQIIEEKKSQKVRHCADNSGRFYDIMKGE